MSKVNHAYILFNSIGNATSLINIKGDVSFTKKLTCGCASWRRHPVMAISCTPPISNVRTATCVIPALTCRVTAEVLSCMTLGQILALENLSQEQRYVVEMCLEAERYEEKLDEYLKDSMFIVFPFLESFWFNGSLIRR